MDLFIKESWPTLPPTTWIFFFSFPDNAKLKQNIWENNIDAFKQPYIQIEA